MKALKGLILCFCLLLSLNNAYAKSHESNFNQVKAQLAQNTELSGDFKQIRRIAVLSQPIISTGTFSLSQKKGLIWQQLTPFKSTLIMTANKITQTIPGMPTSMITQQQQPLVFSFANIFLSLFKGNVDTVRHYFSIQFSGSPQAWAIKLKPLSSPLNRAIANINIRGAHFVKSVTITEVKKDRMILEFSNIKTP